ncbi:MAG TPA: formate--tetrahydrofolate ligase [Candidatus Blautia stercoripullorum]|uniref:non-specific protein-tyrosine kinase n=1 Tax=Candidatus Blautia stercoripullorum TaxID=2838502 RepID=A0A9D2R9S2_9FIRM|nr:formate--tetrahydrofolate ligase [Candidatus Blautia stercoripullorum]
MSDRIESTEKERIEETEKIDIISLAGDFLYGLKKLWLLILVMTLAGAGISYFRTSYTYTPQYVASATMSVTAPGGQYIGAQTASQMAEVFPYILTSGVLEDVVAREMGMDSVPGSISATAEEGTNLLTMSVTSDDPQMAYDILHTVIDCYPEVAEFVLGNTSLTILDETGVPSDTQKEVVVRGSYRRGAVMGAGAGLVILCLYILLKKTVKSKDKLKSQINLPDMGSLPYIRNKKRKKKPEQNKVSLINERTPASYQEAMRRLRIRVLKEVEENQTKTIMVTSSIPGEGKTTVAVNLAISLVRQGKKVVLVDCDLRNPSIADFLGITEQRPGIDSVLHKKAAVTDVLTEIDVNGENKLTLLLGEEEEKTDISLLGSKRMEGLIAELKNMADVVILDTAPAQLLADAALMARFVDAALYVIRYDYTKMYKIREGIQALAMSKIKMLGYVFNCDRNSGDGKYGYGYGYGYRRYGSYGHYGRYRDTGKRDKKEDLSGRVIKD